jgi:hypothetical protein
MGVWRDSSQPLVEETGAVSKTANGVAKEESAAIVARESLTRLTTAS